MKTADEILSSYTQATVNHEDSLFTWKTCVEAMEEYANHKLTQAAVDASIAIGNDESVINAILILKS